MKAFFVLLLSCILLGSCSEEVKLQKPLYSKSGKWTVEKEVVVEYFANQMEDMNTYIGEADFHFEKDLTGKKVSNDSVYPELPFKWEVTKDKLTIDYVTGIDPVVYQIKKQDKENLVLFLRERIYVSAATYDIKETTYYLKKSK